MRNVLGAVIGIVGLGLIVYSAGWIAALGVFIAMWGNNAQRPS